MLFTKENAVQYAIKSAETRKRNAAELRERANVLTMLREERKTSEPVAIVPAADDYRARRLARVRNQLDKLDAMIEEEIDPQKLDRLASAQARLDVQEAALSGRGRPANEKPSRANKRPSILPEPSPIEPEPSAPAYDPGSDPNAPNG